MNISVSEFWALLRKSGLLAPSKVDSLRSNLGLAGKADSVGEVARHLVTNGFLTQYQARMLSQGQSEFMFGDYVIREPAEQDILPGWYVAEDRGRRGKVLLKPISATGSTEKLVVRASQYLANVRLGAASGRRFLLAAATNAPPPPPVAVAATPPSIEANTADTARGRERVSSKLPILLSLVGLAVLVVAGVGAWRITHSSEQTADDQTTETRNQADDAPQLGFAGETRFELTDSPEQLWARPEFGKPIDLCLLPPGVQAIVRLRLAKLIAHPEGDKILRSLGPEIEGRLHGWLQHVGVDGTSLEILTLGLLPQGTIWPKTVAVGELVSETELATVKSFGEMSEDRITRIGQDAIWFPEGHDRTFVFGPYDVVEDLRTKGESNNPLLRRELEQLRQATHDTDHVTILANPNFLRDEAQGLFAGPRGPLLDGLYEFWSDHAQAVSWGLQVSDVAVAELRMIVREDWSPKRLNGHVSRQLESMPSRVSDFLGRVQLDRYWQRLALRFPAMLRFVTEQTRVVAEGRQVAVSTALPVEAVHNLLLASELTLASPVTDREVAEEDRSTWTITDVLATTMTVRFAQKSLELAMSDVARQVQNELGGLPFEFAIEIIGTDLQPEGITRNQQIRDFNEVDHPLGDILTALAMKANPVQAVTRPSDPEQKLVWVVAEGKSPRILITTRSAAARKQWILPQTFHD